LKFESFRGRAVQLEDSLLISKPARLLYYLHNPAKALPGGRIGSPSFSFPDSGRQKWEAMFFNDLQFQYRKSVSLGGLETNRHNH
jgi:hypothetical protein